MWLTCIIGLLIFGILDQSKADFMENVKNVAETGVAVHGGAIIVKNVFLAAKESTNFDEFIVNLDQQEKHQKLVEGRLLELQKSVKELKKAVDRLEFKDDLNHFNSHIKIPMKHVFHAVEKFLQRHTNSSRAALSHQCHNHLPNSILETLNDFLTDNWLIEQAKFYKFEAPAFNELIAKLDKIVETLVISQAACSGLHKEDAEYDFNKLTKTVKQISNQVDRAKDVVHKGYINYTKDYVTEYLSNYEKVDENSASSKYEIATSILHHFHKKYNYGPFYTVGVGGENKIFSSGMTHYGNLQKEYSYNVNYNKITVFVIFSPFLCENVTANETLVTLVKDLTKDCVDDDSLSDYYQKTCGSNFTCSYAGGCGIFSQADSDRVFASNGGVCIVGGDHGIKVKPIITTKFPWNYKYRPITYSPFSLYPVVWVRSSFFIHPNTRWIGSGTAIFDFNLFNVFEYLEEKKLFMEYNFDILNNMTLMKENDPFRNATQPAKIQSNSDIVQSKQKYSNFKAGYNYVFYGSIICDNGKDIGDDAIVTLIEIDNFSNDDIVSRTPIKNGTFTVSVSSTYSDFPTPTLELMFQFLNCCGYKNYRETGILVNGTAARYSLLDNDNHALFSSL